MARKDERPKSFLERLFGSPDDDWFERERPKRPTGIIAGMGHDALFTDWVVEGDEWRLDAVHEEIRDSLSEHWDGHVPYDVVESVTLEIAEAFEASALEHGWELLWNLPQGRVYGDVSLDLDEDDLEMLDELRDEAISDVLEDEEE